MSGGSLDLTNGESSCSRQRDGATESVGVNELIIREVDERLRRSYGVSRLGNKEDPLDELIFIILSNKSREEVYFATFEALKGRFLDWSQALDASTEEIAETIRFGGLAGKKALVIKQLLNAIVSEVGKTDLSFLRGLDDQAAEAFLRRLPGVGPKTARCVLSYSLDRPAFAIDANVSRLMLRLGWSEHEHVTARVQDHLQHMVPPDIRLSLHVNFVVHGRRVCKQKKPLCDACQLVDLCPSAFLLL